MMPILDEIPRWAEGTTVTAGMDLNQACVVVRVTTKVSGESFGYQTTGVFVGRTIEDALRRQADQIGRFVVFGKRP